MSGANDSGILDIAGFHLDIAARRLTAPDGSAVALKSKVFDTLVYLATHPGVVLDKHDILAAVWPGVVVEENSLNQTVSLLRKAFGATRGQSWLVATIPGRGYQLVAPVRRVVAHQITAAPAPVQPMRLRLIAMMLVLAAGAAVLTLWRLPSSGEAPTRPALAQPADDLYLRAQHRLESGGGENLARAEALFREALLQDPGSLPAQIGLAQTLTGLAPFFPERADDVMAEADRLIAHMIERAPEVADGHAMRAARLLVVRGDLLGARHAVDAGIRQASAPEAAKLEANWLWVLRSMAGSTSVTIDAARTKSKADPLSLAASSALQQMLYAAGRVDEAEAEYQRSRDLPGDRVRVEGAALVRAAAERFDRQIIQERSTRFRDALPPAQRDMMLDPSQSLDDAARALVELRRELARAPDPSALDPYRIAQWADFYGDPALSLEALTASFRLYGAGTTIPWDGALRHVRSEPGFKELMRRYGYDAYWRSTGEWGDYCRPSGTLDFECS